VLATVLSLQGNASPSGDEAAAITAAVAHPLRCYIDAVLQAAVVPIAAAALQSLVRDTDIERQIN
jgi:hypothetical protein